jgi:hypothetical protein
MRCSASPGGSWRSVIAASRARPMPAEQRGTTVEVAAQRDGVLSYQAIARSTTATHSSGVSLISSGAGAPTMGIAARSYRFPRSRRLLSLGDGRVYPEDFAGVLVGSKLSVVEFVADLEAHQPPLAANFFSR